MAVIADEEDRAAVWQVDLHAHQTVRVAREVVQRDALAEVEAALVKSLPVPVRETAVSVESIRRSQERPQKVEGQTHKSNFR
jgi:hypothetical protein